MVFGRFCIGVRDDHGIQDDCMELVNVRDTPFLDWSVPAMKEIQTVKLKMLEPLDDNESIMTEQLIDIEAWHERMTTLLAYANAYLDLAEQDGLSHRNDNWTDLDRRINLRAGCANVRWTRDIVQGVVDSIKNRLMLGMNLRKRNAGEQSNFRP